jgi:predicted nucleic acid-binding protein
VIPGRYLIDTSALARLHRDADALQHWGEQVIAGLVALCPVVQLEFLYSARSVAERTRILDLLTDAYGWVSMPDRAFDRAAEVQAALTERGTHRSAGVVDLLLAATAELHGLVLLHYDRDFESIGQVTCQPMRWLAEPGSLS